MKLWGKKFKDGKNTVVLKYLILQTIVCLKNNLNVLATRTDGVINRRQLINIATGSVKANNAALLMVIILY